MFPPKFHTLTEFSFTFLTVSRKEVRIYLVYIQETAIEALFLKSYISNTDESQFKKLRVKKESRFKKDFLMPNVRFKNFFPKTIKFFEQSEGKSLIFDT